MIDIKTILESPDRDDEIRKLFMPPPWKHELDIPNGDYNKITCKKCSQKLILDDKDIYTIRIPRIYTTDISNCPIPDRIHLDWNLVKEMLSKLTIEQKVECNKIIQGIFQETETRTAMKILAPEKKVEFDWWLLFLAQPHHYILAAIIAKEITE